MDDHIVWVWERHVLWYVIVTECCNKHGISTDGGCRPMLDVPAHNAAGLTVVGALAFLVQVGMDLLNTVN